MATNTLAQNITQAINDFDGVKTAIAAKGVNVPTGTPTAQYGNLIGSIPAATDALFISSTDWDEVPLPVELSTGMLYVKAFKGDLYIGSSAANTGLWKFTRSTKTFAQIHASGNAWQHFFETSAGELFVATTTVAGTFKLNAARDALTQVWTTYSNAFFEATNGDVFAGGGTANSGIRKLNSTRDGFTQAYSTGNAWSTFFEAANGDIFAAGGNINSVGILKLNANRDAFTQIYATGYNWTVWRETSRGEVFVSSGSVTGLLKLNDMRDGFSIAYASGTNWQHWFESSAGDVFMSSVTAGIFLLNTTRDAFTQVYATGANWQYWHEIEGDVFASSYSTTNSGIVKLNANRDAFTQVHAVGYRWAFLNEARGDYFLTSLVTAGIFKLNSTRDGITAVHPTTNSWQYWHEVDGESYVSSNVANSGVLRLNPSNDGFTVVTNTGSSYTELAHDRWIVSTNTFGSVDLTAEQSAWLIFGQRVGDWFLANSQFVKLTAEKPMAIYTPQGFLSETFTPIADSDGNVFVVNANKNITYSKTPIN